MALIMKRHTLNVLLSSVLLAAGCSGPGEAVGPAGGTVRSADGVSITIPAGALLDEVPITITRVQAAPPGALGPAYHFEPEGLTFKRPVQVVLPYTPSKGLPADAMESVF